MQESALGSVFIFRGRSIGLDYYKCKELMSRVIVLLDMIEQDINQVEEVIICSEEIGVQEGQPI